MAKLIKKYHLYCFLDSSKICTGIFLFIFSISPGLLWSQDLSAPSLHITTEDGLPSDRILSIDIDQDGFAWLGTDKGLSRFDGNHIENYYSNYEDSTSIRSHYILHVMADHATGKIWLGTTKGLSVLDPKTHAFKNYRHDPSSSNSVPDTRANCIIKDKSGIIWIGFKNGGLLQYRPETDDFKRFFCNIDSERNNALICSASIVDIKEDDTEQNIFWLGTDKGIIKFNKSTGAHEQYQNAVNKINPHTDPNGVRCIFPHINGKIYYGTWWAGVYFFDKKTKTFSNLNACYENGTEFFERDIILGFHPKSKHEFWINSTTGLQLYDTRSECIVQSFKNDENRSYTIDHIDSLNRIWSAPRKHGLSIYGDLTGQCKKEYYESSDSKYPTYTVEVLEDTIRKKLFVLPCFSSGLYIKDQITNEWEIIPPPDDYPLDEKGGFQSVDMDFLEDGAILIPEYDNIYWYKPGFEKLELYPVQPPEGTADLRHSLRDKEGMYWISTGNNMLRLDVKKQAIISYENELRQTWEKGLGCDFMAEDIRGNIWIRENNGLLIYEKAKGRFIYHPHDSEGKRALRNLGPLIADKKGRIWIPTADYFLGYAHADSLEYGILKLYGKKDGLPVGKTYSVIEHKGNIYISMEPGPAMQKFDPDTRHFLESYDYRYGFGGATTHLNKISNGRIVIGKQRYINLFQPDSLRSNAEVPRPFVSAFYVFDIPRKLKNSPAESDTIYLGYKENFFSFDISAVAYNYPADIKYEYKLEGLDENWVDGSKRKFAAYTNVPSGDYVFKVRATNNDGVSAAEPSATYIHIATVWWKTIWFWALATVSLMGISYLIYRARIAQVRKKERLKAEYERKLTNMEMSALRAQMNPHFIFNSLNSIDYYIISNEQEKASDYLNRFSRLIRLILQNSKSSIVPLKDDLEALRLYIELESLRFDNLFDYEVKMESGINPENINVPPMILQPFVENAIWHGLMQKKGEKGKLHLTLRKINGHLICIIEDNGIGREAAMKLKSKSASHRKSYGMKITSDRLAMLNKLAGADASVNIFDLKNEDGSAAGTRVELVIPL